MVSRSRARLFVVLIMLTAAIMAATASIATRIPSSFVYSVEASFSQCPKSDKLLVEWLKGQRGIVPHTVSVQRSGPDGSVVRIVFIQVRTFAGDPPFPYLETQCERLGYLGPRGPFVDCSNP